MSKSEMFVLGTWIGVLIAYGSRWFADKCFDKGWL